MADDTARAVSSDAPSSTEGGRTEDAPSGAGPVASRPDATNRDAAERKGPTSAKLPRHDIARRGVSGLVAAAAAAIPFLIMCTERHWRFSIPIGFIACVVSALGILDAMGAFDGDEARVAFHTEARTLFKRLGEFGIAVTVLFVILALAVAGVLPKQIVTTAILVPSVFMCCVGAFYRLGRSVGAFREEDGRDRSLFERHGFWLILLIVLLYLPLLGSYSLTDPWETHYGEVSREMLARDDWISTWWAQDGWFWSKPVLDFWIQAMSFSLLGVKYMPDQMLGAASHGLFPQPEWAARMPVFLITILGVYALYRSVARVFGRRTGFLAGVLLTTMPYWFFLSHQTMTDMPYTGPLTAAMSLLLLGFVTDPEQRVRLTELRIGSRVFRVSAMHLVLGAVIVSVLPQVLYLASRNLTLHLRPTMMGFRFHMDEFFAGSGGGNCGLPGNEACRPDHAVNPQLWPMGAAVLWSTVAGIFLYVERHEQRLKRAYFIGAWYFMSLSMMGKGAPGLVLPIVAAFGFVAVTRRWSELPRLELGALVLVGACVGLPWYVQMFMRHGPPFIDRLIMHDMYKRAFEHVHDTNQGDDVSFRYYVWQLGYGLFPWTGLGAGGLLWWLRRSDVSRDRHGEAASMMMVWFLAAFGMFTITLTKFHHYILPLVPAIAVLAAVLANRFLGESIPVRAGKLPRYLAGGTLGVLVFVYGIARLFPSKLDGAAYTGHPPSKALGVACIVMGVAIVIAIVRRFAERETPSADPRARYDASMLAVLGIASAVVVGLVGRDLFSGAPGSALPGQLRLMNLFTYNYSRPWPDTLDFSGALVGFTIAAALLSLGLAVNRWRAHAMLLFFVAGAVWTAWGIDIYFYNVAPHWGQRETTLAYYRDRTNPNQPFVAYQMNWKGENFYTSNKVPAFVSSGERFTQWVDEQKKHGIRRVYFVTETGRIGSLKRELGQPKSFTEITNRTLDNKFTVARIEF